MEGNFENWNKMKILFKMIHQHGDYYDYYTVHPRYLDFGYLE